MVIEEYVIDNNIMSVFMLVAITDIKKYTLLNLQSNCS